MKKKLIKFIILFFMTFIVINLNTYTAKADTTEGDASAGADGTEDGTAGDAGQEAVEAPAAYQITITQYPTKVTYSKGEDLDLSDMVVTSYYMDGTTGIITDYQVIGYNRDQVGTQTVIVVYQNLMAAFTVTVVPAKVTNVAVSDHSQGSFTLTWDAGSSTARYEVYCLDDYSGMYYFYSLTNTNSMTFSYLPGTYHSYRIAAVENILGVDYRGELSDTITAATDPEAVTDLQVTGTTPSSISLTWPEVYNASGYLIFRSPAGTDSYELCGRSVTASFTDEGLVSGQGYKYKVCAYVFSDEFTGFYSPIVDISTNPAKMAVKYKAGDGKVRITWPTVNGADSCEIYIGDDINGYTLLTSSNGSGGTYIAEGLITGNTYNFYAIAHRSYNGVLYDSPVSDLKTINMVSIEQTSTKAKLFAAEADFINSSSFLKIPYFAKYVKYSKSFIIPGLVTTNVGGFSSTAMCPQGITFTDAYLLVTAYDLAGEENSVIYVMDKSSKNLLTTLILPSKLHAGGVCYDGFNIWVTNGSRVSSIPLSVVDEAVISGGPYVYVGFNSTVSLGIVTSYTAYYDGKLWVGSYNELKSTNMYSYTIDNKETKPGLTKQDTILMPTRVQGVAFTKSGILIVSRSCQTRSGMRGYMRQIDSYKPDYKNAVNGVISLGKVKNTVSMPSMNEGIAIYGSYLYVNFESGAFADATYKMDRICAFKYADIVLKKE